MTIPYFSVFRRAIKQLNAEALNCALTYFVLTKNLSICEFDVDFVRHWVQEENGFLIADLCSIA